MLTIKPLVIIISISVVFGLLGFIYSFLGLFNTTKNITLLDPFHLLTVQEIGGHILFGYVASIPFRNVKLSLLMSLMALTIDSDHLLNIAGFHIQGRIDHSVPFAIISSIGIGFIAEKIYFKILEENDIVNIRQPALNEYKKTETQANHISTGGSASRNKDDDNNNNNKKQTTFFVFFSFLTLSAFLSHIAYDVFVDDEARFPLLAPFSFSEIIIPRSYWLTLEIAAFFVSLWLYLQYAVTTGKPHL